jgi:hypothetical protein
MFTRTSLEILNRASRGQLPRTIDPTTTDVDLKAFNELYRAGLIEAVDISADFVAYLEPEITFRGRQLLQQESHAHRPWWANFDRRLAVGGFVFTILGIAVSFFGK